MRGKTIIAGLVAAVALAACGERDIILPGERLSIRPAAAVETSGQAISLPGQVVNGSWTHRGGDADHKVTHPALSPGLAPVFAVNIGEGDSRRARITADPVGANGVIYTLDARNRVTATASNGQTRWVRDLAIGLDNRGDASGGGLALGGGRLFVTSGFGDVTALDAATGSVLWTQDLDAPGGASPTVFGELLYLTARDNTAWAIETDTGRIRWQLSGTPSAAGFAGGGGPAVNSELAIFPFSSGQVIAAFRQGGLQRWSAFVTGTRAGSAAATIGDLSGDPVIVGDRVYVGNVAGQIAALDIASGDRVWTATEGAVSPVWPVSNAVFAVNDLGELVRLDAANGAVVWRVTLPQGDRTTGIFRQWRKVNAHYGPVLAGGRLLVASSDGQLRAFSPQSGALVGAVALPGGAASNPMVMGGTVYVVSKSGQLLAFR